LSYDTSIKRGFKIKLMLDLDRHELLEVEKKDEWNKVLNDGFYFEYERELIRPSDWGKSDKPFIEKCWSYYEDLTYILVISSFERTGKPKYSEVYGDIGYDFKIVKGSLKYFPMTENLKRQYSRKHWGDCLITDFNWS